MSRKKKFVLENLSIDRYAAEGKCIGKVDEKVIFVEGAVPGDVANVFVYKNKKDWAEARVNQIVSYSKDRVEPVCDYFTICGGCKWQMLPYERQLEYKEQQVKDQLKRIGNVAIGEYLPIKGCSTPYLYRNKLEFTFSNKQYLAGKDLGSGMPFEKNVLGFHAPKLFDKVIDIETCHLQAEPTNAIKNFIRNYAVEKGLSFHDIRLHQGLMRNLIIRVSTLGEIMLNLVFAQQDDESIKAIMDAIKNQFPEIHSLNYTVNTKLNDTIYDLEVIKVYGKDHILERLGDFQFKISPKSFFQTNSLQAETLYNVVKEFADCKGDENVYDLYCGTGSIGIFLSREAKTIIGVETVEDAVADAKENALLNHLTNARFFSGDVIKVCDDQFFAAHGQPDVVILDPPRAGCHEKLIDKLKQVAAPKIVYVSCNPATQARDLAWLSSHYDCIRSCAVDMFPQTHHVENVVLLTLKKDMN